MNSRNGAPRSPSGGSCPGASGNRCSAPSVRLPSRGRAGSPLQNLLFLPQPLLLFLLYGLLALTACGEAPVPDADPSPPAAGESAAAGPPIVLITIEGLRADAVGALAPPEAQAREDHRPSASRQLDRLIEEVRRGATGWAGTAVAPSSWTPAANASLFTGLRPWQHGLIDPGRGRLAEHLDTLPAVLSARGYQTSGYTDGYWLQERFGWSRGFDFFRGYGQGQRARGHLASLAAGEMVWVHLRGPEPPFERRDWLLGRLGLAGRELPARLDGGLAPGMGPRRRRDLADLYRVEVAWTDRHLGELLDGLRESGRWDDAWLVVVGNHGLELGEGPTGWIGAGQGLTRAALEVPLVVKAPVGRGAPPPPRPPVDSRRLWATLAAVAGVERPPAVAPGLYEDAPATGVVSELYFVRTGRPPLVEARNRFSLVVPAAPSPSTAPEGAQEEGLRQLLWDRPLLPRGPSPELEETPEEGGAGDRGSRGPRLRRAYQQSPPLSRPPSASPLRVEAWPAAGGTAPVEDPSGELAAGLAATLQGLWSEGLERELPPLIAHPPRPRG